MSVRHTVCYDAFEGVHITVIGDGHGLTDEGYGPLLHSKGTEIVHDIVVVHDGRVPPNDGVGVDGGSHIGLTSDYGERDHIPGHCTDDGSVGSDQCGSVVLHLRIGCEHLEDLLFDGPRYVHGSGVVSFGRGCHGEGVYSCIRLYVTCDHIVGIDDRICGIDGMGHGLCGSVVDVCATDGDHSGIQCPLGDLPIILNGSGEVAGSEDGHLMGSGIHLDMSTDPVCHLETVDDNGIDTLDLRVSVIGVGGSQVDDGTRDVLGHDLQCSEVLADDIVVTVGGDPGQAISVRNRSHIGDGSQSLQTVAVLGIDESDDASALGERGSVIGVGSAFGPDGDVLLLDGPNDVLLTCEVQVTADDHRVGSGILGSVSCHVVLGDGQSIHLDGNDSHRLVVTVVGQRSAQFDDRIGYILLEDGQRTLHGLDHVVVRSDVRSSGHHLEGSEEHSCMRDRKGSGCDMGQSGHHVSTHQVGDIES